jgi:hypothetical protein
VSAGPAGAAAGNARQLRAPSVPAPRLADVLGRHAPDLRMHRVRRRPVEAPPPPDPRAAARAALQGRLAQVRPGDTVAVGVGSRGIAGIAEVVAGLVEALQDVGARPFVVPAMGSHGGASAQGQAQTLAGLGVSEAALGVPVRATMATVRLGRADDVEVAVDAYAAEADHVLVVNRLKSHTSFSGEVESGLAKMLAIGLGKQHGAEELHRLGPGQLERRIRTAARHLCDRLQVLGGVALVEGPAKHLVAVELVEPDGIGGAREAELLRQAKGHEARLPAEQLDVLVVDLMGKELSGTGMDTNVLGRRMVRSMPELPAPCITAVVCCEVSAGSHGNAVGLGLADFVPERALAGFDPTVTYANALTAGSQAVQRAKIPIVLADDVDAVSAAMLTCDVPDLSEVRLMRIRNTLHLDEIMVSESLLDEVSGRYQPTATAGLFGEGGRLAEW